MLSLDFEVDFMLIFEFKAFNLFPSALSSFLPLLLDVLLITLSETLLQRLFSSSDEIC
jgi:hypothetical protein